MDFEELMMRGYCCSQVITEASLACMGKEDPDMVQAVQGLCGGMHMGATCGIVSAAVMMMYLKDPYEAPEKQEEFIEWFTEEFGSIECDELVHGNALEKAEKCPGLIENGMAKLAELMEWI